MSGAQGPDTQLLWWSAGGGERAGRWSRCLVLRAHGSPAATSPFLTVTLAFCIFFLLPFVLA